MMLLWAGMVLQQKKAEAGTVNTSTRMGNQHDENKQEQGLFGLLKSNALVREISLVLLVKFLLIVLLWWLFFDVPEERALTSKELNQRILGSHSILYQRRNR